MKRTITSEILNEHLGAIDSSNRFASRRRSIEKDERGDLFTLLAENMRDLDGGQAPAAKAANQIGAFRLDLAKLNDDIARGFFERFMRLLALSETLRLDAIDPPIGREKQAEMAKVQDIAEHPGDAEEGRASLPAPAIDGHDMAR